MDGVSPDQYDDAMQRAIVDLLRSDIPLDAQSRELIAVTFVRLAHPKKQIEDKKLAEADAWWRLKERYQARGKTVDDAKEEAAKPFGSSGGAMAKRRQRAMAKRRQRAK